MSKLLVFAGSARTGSLNRRLAAVAAQIASAQGAQATLIDLRDYALPLYDGDMEASSGVPQAAHALCKLIAAHDALLIATPEYNGFATPLIVNTFSWLSRIMAKDEQPSGLAVLAGKPAALLAASPGALGGVRSLIFTRQYLSMNLGLLVIPEQHGLAQANLAFDEQGALKEPKQQQAVERVVKALIRAAHTLRAGA